MSVEVNYVTTEEAAKYLKVSARSVRRKVKNLSADLSEYVRKDGGKYLIDKRLVASNFRAFEHENEAEKQSGAALAAPNQLDVVEVLQEQLKTKDRQIDSLHKRIEEQNIIIARSQEQLNNLLAPSRTEKANLVSDEPSTKESALFVVSILFVLALVGLLFVVL
jgi:excisionase family DNA binding protein